MDFFNKNLKETLEAVNNCIEKKISNIGVKSVRVYHGIRSSNRSKINFIWRSLKYLEMQDILRVNGSTSPKKYEIIPTKKIDIEKVIRQDTK